VKIRPVGAELFHADGRTEGHGEAFCNIANAPRKSTAVFKACTHDKLSH